MERRSTRIDDVIRALCAVCAVVGAVTIVGGVLLSILDDTFCCKADTYIAIYQTLVAGALAVFATFTAAWLAWLSVSEQMIENRRVTLLAYYSERAAKLTELHRVFHRAWSMCIKAGVAIDGPSDEDKRTAAIVFFRNEKLFSDDVELVHLEFMQLVKRTPKDVAFANAHSKTLDAYTGFQIEIFRMNQLISKITTVNFPTAIGAEIDRSVRRCKEYISDFYESTDAFSEELRRVESNEGAKAQELENMLARGVIDSRK